MRLVVQDPFARGESEHQLRICFRRVLEKKTGAIKHIHCDLVVRESKDGVDYSLGSGGSGCHPSDRAFFDLGYGRRLALQRAIEAAKTAEGAPLPRRLRRALWAVYFKVCQDFPSLDQRGRRHLRRQLRLTLLARQPWRISPPFHIIERRSSESLLKF